MSGFADLIPELVPEWLGKPCQANAHGWSWDLGRGEHGGLLGSNFNHLHNREWVPNNHKLQRDRSGGWALERPGGRVVPGGILCQDDLSFALRSMGILHRGDYRSLWKPGSYSVRDHSVFQRIGPYEQEHDFSPSRKTVLVLPSMPELDGSDLVLDYFAKGMQPPETCDCAPVAISADGFEVPMWKRRTPWGKQEGIALDDLARLVFPVVLDPQLATGGWCNPRGVNANYGIAHATALNNSGAACFFCGQGQGLGFFTVARHATWWDASAYSGTIGTAEVMLGICSVTVPTADDTFLFARAGWAANSCIGAASDALFDLVLASVAVTGLGTVNEYDALGVDVYGPWKPLAAADCAHLNANNGLGGNLYWGLMTLLDQAATQPPSPSSIGLYLGQTPSLTVPPLLSFTFGAEGGFVWLVS